MYDSSLGKITYNGPSEDSIRSHFSAKNGVKYLDGVFSLDSSASSTPFFQSIHGPALFDIDPTAIGDNTCTVRILWNLQGEGTQSTINSTTVTINDKVLELAD